MLELHIRRIVHEKRVRLINKTSLSKQWLYFEAKKPMRHFSTLPLFVPQTPVVHQHILLTVYWGSELWSTGGAGGGLSCMWCQLLPKARSRIPPTVLCVVKDWAVWLPRLSLYVFTTTPSDPGTVYERKYAWMGSTLGRLWEVPMQSKNLFFAFTLSVIGALGHVGGRRSMIICYDWCVLFCRAKWVLKYPNLRAWGQQSLSGSLFDVNNEPTTTS